MKLLTIVLISTALFTACGKVDNSVNAPKEDSPITVTQAILNIPEPGVFGGGPGLSIGGQNYRIDDTSSPAVFEYIGKIQDRQIILQPYSKTEVVSSYRVTFKGRRVQGMCPSSPTTTCTNISISELTAL